MAEAVPSLINLIMASAMAGGMTVLALMLHPRVRALVAALAAATGITADPALRWQPLTFWAGALIQGAATAAAWADVGDERINAALAGAGPLVVLAGLAVLWWRTRRQPTPAEAASRLRATDDRWFASHEHEGFGRHAHHVTQTHPGNWPGRDHEGVRVVTWEQLRETAQP